MNGKIGSYEIKADQMQIFNSVFILILLPMTEKWLYPRIPNVKQLQRMALGMLFAAIAYVVAGLLEMAIGRAGDDQVNILWQIPQCVVFLPSVRTLPSSADWCAGTSSSQWAKCSFHPLATSSRESAAVAVTMMNVGIRSKQRVDSLFCIMQVLAVAPVDEGSLCQYVAADRQRWQRHHHDCRRDQVFREGGGGEQLRAEF